MPQVSDEEVLGFISAAFTPQTTRQVAEGLGVHKDDVRTVCKNLYDLGKLSRKKAVGMPGHSYEYSDIQLDPQPSTPVVSPTHPETSTPKGSCSVYDDDTDLLSRLMGRSCYEGFSVASSTPWCDLNSAQKLKWVHAARSVQDFLLS